MITSLDSSDSAIVLLSGGLDSTVALADTLSRMPVACVLTFDYGQRAVKRELNATSAIAGHYGLMHRVVSLPWLGDLLPQALMPMQKLQDQNVQAESVLSQEALFNVNRVWVPNRNGLFLNIAACFAEALKVGTIVFGANAEEGMDFPDNTPALNEVFQFSTLTGVRVETPVGHLNKAEIIERGLELAVPFHLIWSCYEATDEQCGQCPSCLRVKQARDRVHAGTGQTVTLEFK
jgi:7-cyano-7-deazaguanine synthase